jgi:hypothetical protein
MAILLKLMSIIQTTPTRRKKITTKTGRYQRSKSHLGGIYSSMTTQRSISCLGGIYSSMTTHRSISCYGVLNLHDKTEVNIMPWRY